MTRTLGVARFDSAAIDRRGDQKRRAGHEAAGLGWTLGKSLRDLWQAPVSASHWRGPANRVRNRTVLT